MKYECEIINDLLPLYADDVCSEASRKAVDEHLAECKNCADTCNKLMMPDQTEIKSEVTPDEKAQIEALKKVKKKWTKTRIVFTAAGMVIAVLIAGFILFVNLILGVFGISFFGGMIKGPEVYEDIEHYTDYINDRKDTDYMISGEEARLFPEEITDDMEVVNFKFVHFNPWDPQTLAYLTVRYSDDDYQSELERLKKIGIDEYKGIYSVTGEPEGFDLTAMETDEYYGFIYAMIPEAEDNTVTYAGMRFCNNFLDLNIKKYIPENYLLEGFNAEKYNPYIKIASEKMRQEQDELNADK